MQSDTHSPYHNPLLSLMAAPSLEASPYRARAPRRACVRSRSRQIRIELSIRKQIWQASRAWFWLFLANPQLYKNASRQVSEGTWSGRESGWTAHFDIWDCFAFLLRGFI